MAEEAKKRHTDCVYFLASPLTCKKGNACEFRHSESARMNPRDCRYWLAGNCLMPNCSFRHPPLDGKPTMVGTTTPVSSASRATLPVTSKSGVPCYFFSQGYCAKGNRCPFLHGTEMPVSNETSYQKPQEASTGGQTETNDKPSMPFKGNRSAGEGLPAQAVTGFAANPPNVFIRVKTPSISNSAATKEKPSAEFSAGFPSKGQSGNWRNEAAENQQPNLQVKDSQLYKAAGSIRTRLKQNQVEHYEWNGVRKERSLLCMDASSNLMYKEDAECVPERSFQHRFENVSDENAYFNHEYENARQMNEHELIKATEGFIYDSNNNNIIYNHTQSNNSSSRSRTGGDLREYLTRQRMLHKEQYLTINGENLNFEDVEYPTAFDRQQLSEQRVEYSWRPSDKGEYRDLKRLRHDIDYETDKMMHRGHGHAKSKLKSGSSEWFESDINSGYPTSTIAFSGPKSLAQIKAEQGKEIELRGHRDERQRGLYTGLSNRPIIKSQILAASSFDFAK